MSIRIYTENLGTDRYCSFHLCGDALEVNCCLIELNKIKARVTVCAAESSYERLCSRL